MLYFSRPTFTKGEGAIMTTIPAYFDGSTVRTLDAYPFEKDQKLIITVLDDTATNHGRLPANFDAEKELAKTREQGIKSLRGSLAEYANPALIAKEKDAWASAVREKYGLR